MTTDVHIDVRAAIEQNSYLTSVTDLERRGKRQVKVIRTSLIYDLIQQAVENVQRGREAALGEEERQRLVDESKAEFDRLLAEQQQHRRRLEDLQQSNAQYEEMANELKRGLAEHVDRLQAEMERARALAEENAGLHAEIEQLRQQEAARDGSAGQLHELIRRREAELEAARGASAQSEDYRLQIASLTAELKAVRENQPATDSLLHELREMREDLKTLESRNRELEAIAAAAPAPKAAAEAGALEMLLEKKMAQISAELSAKLASLKPGADVGTSPEDIKLTIQRIFSHELDGKVDSNIGEIKVKETRTGGIAENLERLKNLGLKSDRK
ncbi:MAG: hypothetical protein JXQ29_08895 [Planctomycetes bacterium]|nr:hypothetical protein [Planctomycetota bacterium]